MLRTIRLLSLALAFGLAAISTLRAAETPESNFVTEKGFKSAIFQVKNRDAQEVATALWALGSGFKGATVLANRELRTITVRDFPENIATMEDAVKRLDVPAPPKSSGTDIELHMYVLFASNAAESGSTPLPPELTGVIVRLRQTLQYKHYDLTASIVQRLTESDRGTSGAGTSEMPGTNSVPFRYEYKLEAVSLGRNEKNERIVQIERLSFDTVGAGNQNHASISTALSLREGEKVVVGTTTLQNRGLAVVLSVDVLD